MLWWLYKLNRENEMAYCNCANTHKPGCPNDKPDGLPPLRIGDDKRQGK